MGKRRRVPHIVGKYAFVTPKDDIVPGSEKVGPAPKSKHQKKMERKARKIAKAYKMQERKERLERLERGVDKIESSPIFSKPKVKVAKPKRVLKDVLKEK